MERKYSKKKQGIGLLLFLFFAVLTGCSSGQEDGTQEEELTGSMVMAGSTSMEKLSNAFAESFMQKYPGVMINAEFTGSSAGIEALLEEMADVGNSSRNLKESELNEGAVENIVAIDTMAIVVDESNPLEEISKQQLVDIYTGKVRNWSQVGGAPGAIVVVGREAGSGTRGTFEELLGVEDRCRYANELDSVGAVMAKVGATKGAIGYVSLDAVNEGVRVLAIDGVKPTEENSIRGSYFLSRPFVMATRGSVHRQNPVVQTFFSWVYSEEGRQVIRAVGLIPVEGNPDE